MTTQWHRLAALLLTGGLCLSVALLAAADEGKKGKKTGDDEDAANDVIEVLATAYKTAEFGRKHDCPEALVAAAQMLRTLKAAEKKWTPIAEQPTDEDGNLLPDKALARASFAAQANDLFDEASVMALELKRKGFDAYIQSAKDAKLRAVVGGAKAIRRQLGAGQTAVYRFKFEHQRLCEIAIRATQPVHFHAAQHKDVWADSVVLHGALRRLPAGKLGGASEVTIKVRNPNKKGPVVYEMFVR